MHASIRSNSNCSLFDFDFSFFILPGPSIIHVILLNRTLRILCLLGIFCTLIPIADYFYFYSSQIVEHQTDDSGSSICSHYPIYQIPCGVEVSKNFHILIILEIFSLTLFFSVAIHMSNKLELYILHIFLVHQHFVLNSNL